eukprot:6242498-Pyramimonas_sp.AAC.1
MDTRNRANVAVTRAKRLAVLIGDGGMFGTANESMLSAWALHGRAANLWARFGDENVLGCASGWKSTKDGTASKTHR